MTATDDADPEPAGTELPCDGDLVDHSPTAVHEFRLLTAARFLRDDGHPATAALLEAVVEATRAAFRPDADATDAELWRWTPVFQAAREVARSVMPEMMV